MKDSVAKEGKRGKELREDNCAPVCRFLCVCARTRACVCGWMRVCMWLGGWGILE